jgi:hypothetical protein
MKNISNVKLLAEKNIKVLGLRFKNHVILKSTIENIIFKSAVNKNTYP